MKRLLVTGASGFLGRHIVEAYREKDYVLLTPTHKELDLTNELQVASYIENNRPDYVVHCAAVSDVGTCEKNPEESWIMNVRVPEYLVKYSAKIGAKCILCSSDQVYLGLDLQIPREENVQLEPANVYGREKLQMEQTCLELDSTCVLLRLTWMYESREEHLAEHKDFWSMLWNNLQHQNALTYPIYDIRGITDVSLAVENLEKTFTLPGGVYNYGSENTQSTYDTVREAFKEAGMNPEQVGKNLQAFADQPRDISMITTKAQAQQIHFPSTKERLVQLLKKVVVMD